MKRTVNNFSNNKRKQFFLSPIRSYAFLELYLLSAIYFLGIICTYCQNHNLYLTHNLLQLSFLILYTEMIPEQLLFPLPAPCNAQLGQASSIGLDPLGVFLGIVARVAGTPALSRGIDRKNLSGVISKPVNTVFSGLKKE